MGVLVLWSCGIGTAVSTLLAGVACPILGAIADRYSARKYITYVTAALSIVFGTIFAFSSRHSPWQELLAVPPRALALALAFAALCWPRVSSCHSLLGRASCACLEPGRADVGGGDGEGVCSRGWLAWWLQVTGLAMMFTSIMHCFYNSLLMIVSGTAALSPATLLSSSLPPSSLPPAHPPTLPPSLHDRSASMLIHCRHSAVAAWCAWQRECVSANERGGGRDGLAGAGLLLLRALLGLRLLMRALGRQGDTT